MTDREIIERVKQDNYSAALNGLYHSLPLVKKFITANNGTTNDAEDIFQDALVILCKKIRTENFSLTAPLKSYLFAIVKNCWFQELRQRKKMPVSEPVNDIGIAEQDEEPEFVFAKKAFNSLGEKCRQLLSLFYFNKMNYKMIAAAMAFGDEHTAKNQKYRCLQKAKEHYSMLLKNDSHE